MRPRRALLVVLAFVAAVAAVVTSLQWARLGGPTTWAGASAPVRWTHLTATTGATADALTREAVALFADGQYAAACERFRRAADDDPETTARRDDVGRCFEGWAWQTLREGRADEAMLLFRQGLRDQPDAAGLLRGLGVSAVHAGRPDEALGPLEAAVRRADDHEVRLLLAHLWDRRDDPARARRHLHAMLARDPGHEAASRLLAKLERERRVEAAFDRELTEHFVLKTAPTVDAGRRRLVAGLLENAWARVAADLEYRPRERATVVLYAAEDWHRATGVHAWASGLFDGKIRLPVSAIVPAAGDLERLIRHEYAHAAVHEIARGRAPRWLQEGLAQTFEGATVDPLLKVPGQPTLAGIEALLADSDALRAKTGYDVALWVVADLLDRGGMPAMRDLLARLGAGAPLSDAMLRVYGLRLAELEGQWRRLLGG